MTTYRRRRLSDVWHYCAKCRWWPRMPLTYVERERPMRPTYGELCNECVAKARKGECL